MKRSRRYDAMRTAAGKCPWTRGDCQERLDVNRGGAIDPDTDTAPGRR